MKKCKTYAYRAAGFGFQPTSMYKTAACHHILPISYIIHIVRNVNLPSTKLCVKDWAHAGPKPSRRTAQWAQEFSQKLILRLQSFRMWRCVILWLPICRTNRVPTRCVFADGGSMFLRNVGNQLPAYKASHPERYRTTGENSDELLMTHCKAI